MLHTMDGGSIGICENPVSCCRRQANDLLVGSNGGAARSCDTVNIYEYSNNERPFDASVSLFDRLLLYDIFGGSNLYIRKTFR